MLLNFLDDPHATAWAGLFLLGTAARCGTVGEAPRGASAQRTSYSSEHPRGSVPNPARSAGSACGRLRSSCGGDPTESLLPKSTFVFGFVDRYDHNASRTTPTRSIASPASWSPGSDRCAGSNTSSQWLRTR